MIMTEMSKGEIARFLMQGTLTGKLAIVNKDGSSDVIPIWFVLDNENKIPILPAPKRAREARKELDSLVYGLIPIEDNKRSLAMKRDMTIYSPD